MCRRGYGRARRNHVPWMNLANLRPFLLAGLLATAWFDSAVAQEFPQPTIDASEPAAEYKHDKLVHAHRIAGTPPRIDGLPNDEVWGQAEAVEGLIQWDPDNGDAMTE